MKLAHSHSSNITIQLLQNQNDSTYRRGLDIGED